MGGAPPRGLLSGSGLQVTFARPAGPEAFGLAAATSATVALWAGGGEESIPGGPPVRLTGGLPGPALACPKRFTEAALQSSLQGAEIELCSRGGDGISQSRPRMTWSPA